MKDEEQDPVKRPVPDRFLLKKIGCSYGDYFASKSMVIRVTWQHWPSLGEKSPFKKPS